MVNVVIVVIELLFRAGFAAYDIHSRKKLLGDAAFPMAVVTEGVRNSSTRPWVLAQEIGCVYG